MTLLVKVTDGTAITYYGTDAVKVATDANGVITTVTEGSTAVFNASTADKAEIGLLARNGSFDVHLRS